jgi:hypothetical protein
MLLNLFFAVNLLQASRGVMRAMIETLSHTADGARIVPRLLDLAQREFNLAIDITFYNLWLSALRFAEHPPTPEAIRELYDQIAARGLMPDKVTFNSLIVLLDLVPLEQDVTRHVHFFLHEWWRVSRHAGKDSVTNNLLLRVLGSRHTEHSNVVCIRIYKFMKSSEDPQQWPDSYTFHTLVKVCFFVAVLFSTFFVGVGSQGQVQPGGRDGEGRVRAH